MTLSSFSFWKMGEVRSSYKAEVMIDWDLLDTVMANREVCAGPDSLRQNRVKDGKLSIIFITPLDQLFWQQETISEGPAVAGQPHLTNGVSGKGCASAKFW